MATSSPCVRAPCREDGLTASFAGQQESYLNVRGGDAVLDRVQECWASFFSPRALFYRAQKAVLGDTRMAVVVQEMVQADKSGVMFTVDPIRNRRECMIIEGAPGLGEAIVSGEITPDHYVVSRDDGAHRRRRSSRTSSAAACCRRLNWTDCETLGLAARGFLWISAGRRMVHPRRRAAAAAEPADHDARRAWLIARPNRRSSSSGGSGSSRTIPTTARIC